MTLRQEARILAFQILYSRDVVGRETPFKIEEWEGLVNKQFSLEAKHFAQIIVEGVESHLLEIDSCIEKHLTNWTLVRLRKIDLIILRMSVYSLLYQKDIPFKVLISESMKIARKYSNENSPKFISGVLNAISDNLVVLKDS